MWDSSNFGSGGNLVKLRRILVLAASLVLLSLTGCGSLEEAVQQAKKTVPGDWKIVHTQEVQAQATVVFYVKDDELGAGLFKKDTFGWNWLGSGQGILVTYPDGLSWRYSDLGSKTDKFYLYYGLVHDPNISKIEVKTTWGEVSKAKITESGNDRLWYAFISKPQVPSVDADIMGYSTDGEVRYLFSQPKQGVR
jgi:hypothetical protein